MSDADQVMEILKDKLRKSQAEVVRLKEVIDGRYQTGGRSEIDYMNEVEALRLKTRNPEEHIDNYEGDCEHLSARCAECRWPLWTKRQVALIDRDAKQAYHLFHGDLAPDDCVHCELETLRTDARTLKRFIRNRHATLDMWPDIRRILAEPEPAESTRTG